MQGIQQMPDPVQNFYVMSTIHDEMNDPDLLISLKKPLSLFL